MNKNDDLPSVICSGCLKKLLTYNTFRKQCVSVDYQLKLLLNDFKERKLFETIDGDLTKTDSDEIEVIEYIDDSMEIFISNDESTQNDDNESITVELEMAQAQDQEQPKNDMKREKDDEEIYDEQDDDRDENDDKLEQIESFDESGTEMEEQSNMKGDRKVNKGRRTCNICGKRVVNLKPHMDTHVEIENRRKPYRCEYCGKEYLQRAQFDGHVNKEHTGLKPFKCDFNGCNKTFHGRPSLRMHKIQHTAERRFNCEYCPRSYLYAHHLSHHRYTHTKERIFSCTHCDYTNVHMENLKRHILSKHTEAEDKPYQCRVCSRSFNGQSNLKRHLKYVHSLTANRSIDCNSGDDGNDVEGTTNSIKHSES